MFHSRAQQCLNRCPTTTPLEHKINARHNVQITDHQLDIWMLKSADPQPAHLRHSLQTDGALQSQRRLLG